MYKKYKTNKKKEPTKVLKYLYIGGEKDIQYFIEQDCNIIIDLRNESNNNLNVPIDKIEQHFKFPMHDGVIQVDKSEKKFIEALDILKKSIKSKKKVAVMCHEGVSRSATLVLLYLMSKGKSLNEAITYLSKKRPIIAPHPDFHNLLENYNGINKDI